MRITTGAVYEPGQCDFGEWVFTMSISPDVVSALSVEAFLPLSFVLQSPYSR